MKKIKKRCETCIYAIIGHFKYHCKIDLDTNNNGAFCVSWEKRLPKDWGKIKDVKF